MKKTPRQHEAIKLLTGPAKDILLAGGSRSGKTAILLYAVIVRSLKHKSRHAILRHAFNHAKTTIWHDSLPKLLESEKIPHKLNSSDMFVQMPNGSEIWIGGLDDKERTEKILGAEYSTIYFNEISQIGYPEINIARTRLAQKTGLVNKAYYDCNPPTKNHWAYKLFVKGIDPVTKEAINTDNYAMMVMNPKDNLENLPEDYVKTLETLPYRQRQRFLDGLWLDEIEGALWTDQMIDDARITGMPAMKYKVIAIDPAVSYGEDSDETGIIIAGKGYDDHYYVINDLSGKYAPGVWGNLVIKHYQSEMCNAMVAEVNQGGELVVQNIRQLNKAIMVKRVHASQGKLTRAEPITALYEQGLVHHIGRFPELEEQMTSYTGKGMKSPDRMDALVWALTDLSEAKQITYWA